MGIGGGPTSQFPVDCPALRWPSVVLSRMMAGSRLMRGRPPSVRTPRRLLSREIDIRGRRFVQLFNRIGRRLVVSPCGGLAIGHFNISFDIFRHSNARHHIRFFVGEPGSKMLFEVGCVPYCTHVSVCLFFCVFRAKIVQIKLGRFFTAPKLLSADAFLAEVCKLWTDCVKVRESL